MRSETFFIRANMGKSVDRRQSNSCSDSTQEHGHRRNAGLEIYIWKAEISYPNAGKQMAHRVTLFENWYSAASYRKEKRSLYKNFLEISSYNKKLRTWRQNLRLSRGFEEPLERPGTGGCHKTHGISFAFIFYLRLLRICHRVSCQLASFVAFC